jgi:hypothetical protein
VDKLDRRPSDSQPSMRAEESSAPAALRAQILETEHWSLLATRGISWSEIFNRTGIFLTVLSAAVVALSLVAQGTGLGRRFAPLPCSCFRSRSLLA